MTDKITYPILYLLSERPTLFAPRSVPEWKVGDLLQAEHHIPSSPKVQFVVVGSDHNGSIIALRISDRKNSDLGHESCIDLSAVLGAPLTDSCASHYCERC